MSNWKYGATQKKATQKLDYDDEIIGFRNKKQAVDYCFLYKDMNKFIEHLDNTVSQVNKGWYNFKIYIFMDDDYGNDQSFIIKKEDKNIVFYMNSFKLQMIQLYLQKIKNFLLPVSAKLIYIFDDKIVNEEINIQQQINISGVFQNAYKSYIQHNKIYQIDKINNRNGFGMQQEIQQQNIDQQQIENTTNQPQIL